MPSPVPSPHRRGLRGDAPGRPAHPTAVGATPVSVSPWKFPGLGTRCQLSPRPGGWGLSSESHAPPRVVARSADRDAKDVPPAHAGLATAAPAAAPLAEKWGSLGDAAEGMPGGRPLRYPPAPCFGTRSLPGWGGRGSLLQDFFGGVCVCVQDFFLQGAGGQVSLLQGAGGESPWSPSCKELGGPRHPSCKELRGEEGGSSLKEPGGLGGPLLRGMGGVPSGKHGAGDAGASLLPGAAPHQQAGCRESQ